MIIKRDALFQAVVNIRTPQSIGEIVGTGMFVFKNDSSVWLVTASHVAKETTSKTSIALGDKDNNCIVLPLNRFNHALDWKYHRIADIAILELTINDQTKPYIYSHCFPFDHFNFSNICVSRDFELTSVGFPNGLGVSGKFCPLTFRSYAASSFLTLNRFDTQTPSDFFCLENPSVGGYSGCPVFDLGYLENGVMSITKEKTICHGLMHGTMCDNTGGKIALVTPAYYLCDIL